VGALGLVIDTTLVLRSGAAVRLALASGMTGAALGVVIAFLAALPAALVAVAWAALDRRDPRLPLGLAGGLAALVGSAVTLAPLSNRPTLAVVAAFSAAVVLCAGLARWTRRGRARALAMALGAAALAADVLFDPVQSDVHDLLGMLQVCAVLAATAEILERVRRARGTTLALALAALAVFSGAVLVTVDRAAPGWRVRSERFARMEPRLARAGRAVTDFDEDGSSALFWGGDCDDRDPRRSPHAREQPNAIDANCNGALRPAHPSYADVGLMPPAGDPNSLPGTVDRVVLLTIDCWRADAFNEPTTPNLTRLGRRGVVMDRMTATGTYTEMALAFVQRIRPDEPTVGELLARAGVPSTALLPPQIGTAVSLVRGYTTVSLEAYSGRPSADELTDLLIEQIRTTTAPRLFWAHYLDAHQPGFAPLTSPGVPRSYGEALARIDGAIGRLVSAMESGGMMDRTVFLVTADHGESFGAHGVDYHALNAYEELVHVPAIFVAPGVAPARFAGVVSHRDIPPTILGAFGLVPADGSAERFGRSWMRLRTAPGEPLHRFTVAYSVAGRTGQARVMGMAAIVEPRFKLIETFENNLTEMFDLQADPAEANDLVPALPDEAKRLDRELAIYRDIDGFF